MEHSVDDNFFVMNPSRFYCLAAVQVAAWLTELIAVQDPATALALSDRLGEALRAQ